MAIDATALYQWAKAAGSVYQEQLRRRLTTAGGDLGPRPQRLPGDGRDQRGPAAGVLQADHPDREHLAAIGLRPGDGEGADARPTRRPGSPPGRQRTRPDPTPCCGPLARRRPPRRSADRRRPGRARSAGRPAAGPTQPASIEPLFDLLVDPEVGLCAHDSRFGDAQVVEAVAALGPARCRVDEIIGLARPVPALRSGGSPDQPGPVRAGRRGQWSTGAHRRLEDRLLDHLDGSRSGTTAGRRPSRGATRPSRAGPRLGRRPGRSSPGPVRGRPRPAGLIAPAGHGKTTTLATAVDAAQAAGRPVLAVSTTNQAVDQLRQVGIAAITVARFALDRAHLAAGTS